MNVQSTPDAIASRIIDLRKKYRESQNDLAEAIKCNQNNISKMENGKSLTIENLIAIANHYKVSLDYLCTGKIGMDLLDTLDKYIHYKISNTSGIDERNHLIPHIELNNSLYNCLRQLALAKSNPDMPDKIKEAWINDAKEKFIDCSSSPNQESFTSFIPVKESVLNENDIITYIEEHFVG